MVQYEKRILNALVDSYEKSLLFRGENKVTIHISFPFTRKTMPEYFDESSLKYEDIHACLQELEHKALVTIVWKNGKDGHIVQKVVLNVERLPDIYKYLGRTSKSEQIRQHRELLNELRQKCQTPAAGRFIEYLDQRLAEGAPVKEYIDLSEPDKTRQLIEAIAFVEENTEPCYIREFSIRHFGDSKRFEAMLGTVGKVFRRFEPERFEHSDDRAILAEYSIYHTPNYVYIKGEGQIVIQGSRGEKTILDLKILQQGIGLSGEDLSHVCVQGMENTKKIITIENLTTFFQWQEPDSILIYLGGYHNSVRRRLLQMIRKHMPFAAYLHFGDIDVGGFEIYEDLCEKTGIAFQPYHMGVRELETYGDYARPLTENDEKRLDLLLEKKRKDPGCLYLDTLEYMKRYGIKLEQECIGYGCGRKIKGK